ncbi:uncharacterized protein LOC125037659 [Penaeus chinensis]|uniref:uncharacterized protein LOC125037659 n=1 Tax=Penaeus chinensis TaxID=139456 RepID=UPI001FB7909F|nr:uncharacterized protein LOC125037659 [Penaeus chinensis]
MLVKSSKSYKGSLKVPSYLGQFNVIFVNIHSGVIVSSLASCGPKEVLLVAAVLLSSFAGLTVPLIVKNLDSIVKDYLAALNNVVLGALTAVLFPMHFSFSWPYVMSVGLLLAGIFLYENKGLCKKS